MVGRGKHRTEGTHSTPLSTALSQSIHSNGWPPEMKRRNWPRRSSAKGSDGASDARAHPTTATMFWDLGKQAWGTMSTIIPEDCGHEPVCVMARRLWHEGCGTIRTSCRAVLVVYAILVSDQI